MDEANVPIVKSPFEMKEEEFDAFSVSKKDELSIDQKARLVFGQLDNKGTGYISVDDLALVLFKMTGITDVPENYNPLDDVFLKQMFSMMDPKKSGKIGYADFYHSYTFFEYFRAGYEKGFMVGSAGLRENADLEFHEFWRLLAHDKQLQLKLASFHSTWNTVFRPGLLKTPIHKKEKLSAFEDFIAGSVAGITTTLVAFDTVKVRMQTAAAKATSNPNSSKMFANSEIWNTIMKGSLYKGVSSPLLSIPLVNAVVFAVYEKSKSFFVTKDNSLSESQLAVCGGIAGFFSCFIVSPVEMIRSRMQVQVGPPAFRYKGATDCIKHVIQSHGIKGLTTGLYATILRDVPAYVAQFYVYEGLKKWFTPEGSTVDKLPVNRILLSGGLGGVAGWLVTYPVDVVKSKLQVSPYGIYTRHRFLPDDGFFDCWRKTVAQQGFKGLFKGFIPCVARAFPVNACAFYAYEYSSRFLKNNPLFH